MGAAGGDANSSLGIRAPEHAQSFFEDNSAAFGNDKATPLFAEPMLMLLNTLQK